MNDVEEQEDFIKETLTRRLNDFGGEVIVFMYFTEPFNNEFKESSDLPKKEALLNDLKNHLNQLAENSKSKIILLNKS